MALAWVCVLLCGLRVDYGLAIGARIPYAVGAAGLGFAILLWLANRRGAFMSSNSRPLISDDMLEPSLNLPVRSGYEKDKIRPTQVKVIAAIALAFLTPVLLGAWLETCGPTVPTIVQPLASSAHRSGWSPRLR